MCVLLVEDDNLIRGILFEMLSEYDIPVIVAEDGDVAAVLIDNPPRALSVVLTDFHMPGSRHGLDVADHARLRQPHVHIFIMTGRPDALPHDRLAGYTVLSKPLIFRDLMRRLSEVVAH